MDAESIYVILYEAIRGVQHSVAFGEARFDSFRNRFGMDVGCYAAPVEHGKSFPNRQKIEHGLSPFQVAYNYGVAGPFWYAAGATVQILLFSILACKVKQNAPRCHTYLEIINARYGRAAHLVFMVFAFITNILVGSQLLLGGSAVVTALTGMNVYAAIFLIPVGTNAGLSS